MSETEPAPLPTPPPRVSMPRLAAPWADESVRSRPWLRWGIPVVTLGAAVGVCAYVALVDPNNASNPYPKCALKAATGLDCPACGGLRATHALLHGDLAGVVDHNVLALVILPVLLYTVARWALGYAGIRLPFFRIPRWTFWGLMVVVLAFTVLRNAPIAPFDWLGSSV